METSEVHPALYALSGPSEVVESGGLGSFAVSEAERELVLHNNITILSPAVYFISAREGYHSSNALIGMCESCRIAWLHMTDCAYRSHCTA